MEPLARPISAHVSKRKGARGDVWYAKYRLPDGRQQKKKLGPDWTKKTAPPEGYFTKASAQSHLDSVLAQARVGTLPGMVKTGKTFRDATEEWLAYCENVRDCKATTLNDYRTMVAVLNREFGNRKIESITSQEIELWITGYRGSNRTRQKYLVCLGSIFKRAKKVYGLPINPVDVVERPRVRKQATIEVLRPEEVMALVRAAESKQDAAVFHAAAFAGLRMGELLALRWRDVDFARRTIHVRENWALGQTTTPKGGSERAVPMADEVAARLAKLGQRDHFTDDDDLVFCTERGQHLGPKSLRLRYRAALKAAGLREGFLVPQPAPHLRQHRDPQGRLAGGHGVDGSRRPEHDPPLPGLRGSRGRSQAGLRGVPIRGARGGDRRLALRGR